MHTQGHTHVGRKCGLQTHTIFGSACSPPYLLVAPALWCFLQSAKAHAGEKAPHKFTQAYSKCLSLCVTPYTITPVAGMLATHGAWRGGCSVRPRQRSWSQWSYLGQCWTRYWLMVCFYPMISVSSVSDFQFFYTSSVCNSRVINLADPCLPLLNKHWRQMSSQPVLGPPFPYAVYLPAPILTAVVIQATLSKVSHADTTTSAVVGSAVQKDKLAFWESKLTKMWQKQLRHRQMKGI